MYLKSPLGLILGQIVDWSVPWIMTRWQAEESGSFRSRPVAVVISREIHTLLPIAFPNASLLGRTSCFFADCLDDHAAASNVSPKLHNVG